MIVKAIDAQGRIFLGVDFVLLAHGKSGKTHHHHPYILFRDNIVDEVMKQIGPDNAADGRGNGQEYNPDDVQPVSL